MTMGCGNCGSGGGCSTGGCGGGCATGGCNKLNTYDWLGNMLSPDKHEVDNIYEIRFKNTRKAFYRNVNGLRLYIGDQVVVESDRGYDVGTLSLGGVLAELQMKKRRNSRNSDKEIPRIYRKANENDLELLSQVRDREQETLVRSREIIEELGLDMKLSDVEFQADNAKAIFYYIADHRVDFRELIKVLAREFRIRVEMKQIGLRHEAGLVGGIGSCGRELCCSTWLTDFKTVSTSAARYQNLSLNPMKISGLCGRLKCCLNFELDAYLDALQDFPEVSRIYSAKGVAFLQKTDIFKGKMWFSYPDETTWYPISVGEVKRIVAQNEKGEKPETLSKIPPASLETQIDFVDVVGTALPEVEKRRRGKSKRKRGNVQGKGKSQSGRPNRNNRNRQENGQNQNKQKQNPNNKSQGQGRNKGANNNKGSNNNNNRNQRKGQNPRNQKQDGNSNRANKPQGTKNSGNKSNKNNRNRSGRNRNKPSNPPAKGDA